MPGGARWDRKVETKQTRWSDGPGRRQQPTLGASLPAAFWRLAGAPQKLRAALLFWPAASAQARGGPFYFRGCSTALTLDAQSTQTPRSCRQTRPSTSPEHSAAMPRPCARARGHGRPEYSRNPHAVRPAQAGAPTVQDKVRATGCPHIARWPSSRIPQVTALLASGFATLVAPAARP
jgi:hypothetical protein